MIYIYIDKNIVLNNSDYKIINYLKKKQIIFHFDKENDISYNLMYVKENPIGNEKIYHSMSNILTQLLINYKDIDKLEYLQDLFKDEDIIILAPGPSYSFLTTENKKFIIENYITISLKYTLDDLTTLNLNPTFFIYNTCTTFNNPEHYKKISNKLLSIYISIDKKMLGFLNFNFNRRLTSSHSTNFNKIKKGIDLLYFDLHLFKKNNVLYINLLHIMGEICIPLCVLLGVKNIFTVGWDLKQINNIKYYNNTNNVKLKNIYNNANNTEYDCISSYVKILNNKNINIYKIVKVSPIPLDFYNILPS
jgi:hypothetical protein